MPGHRCIIPGACVTCSRPKDRPFRRRAVKVCGCRACATNRLHAAQAKPGNSTAIAAARLDLADARLRRLPHQGPSARVRRTTTD